jgi:hypothetical protein
MSAKEAIEIYQRVLDIVSDAVLEGDHITIGKYLSKPFHIRTINGWFPINTSEDIEQMVRSTHLSLKLQGATDYVRIASSAEFRADGRIDGVHTTHILRNGTSIVPSYESRMRMEKFDAAWKVTMAKHAIGNFKWPTSVPKVDRGDVSTIDNSAEIDETAIEYYQNYLDEITKINVEDDFEGWLKVCEFPHMVHIDQADRLIEKHEDIRPFFEMVSSMIEENPNDTFKRTADFAGFLDSHTLRGYHTTTFDGPNGDVFAPIKSRMTIRFSAGKWRMIEVVNSIANTEFPYNRPVVSDQMASEFHYPKKDIQ